MGLRSRLHCCGRGLLGLRHCSEACSRLAIPPHTAPRGWEDDDIPQIQTAVDYFGKVEHVFGSERDWIFASEAQEELMGRGLYWPRGKVVGGCSSFNTMVWMRGHARDYDRWGEFMKDEKWSYGGMLPYFKAAENHPYAVERDGSRNIHGAEGPITVAPLNHRSHHADNASNRVTRTFIEAGVQMGVPHNDDFGAATEGVGCNEVNARNGRRCSTSAYLRMVGAYPREGITHTVSTYPQDALEVWLQTHTHRVLFETVEGGEPRAVGVEVKCSDRMKYVRAREEVIVSCGAVGSPVLLMVSGVGPKEQLEACGVPVVAALPGVGSGLVDHLHVPLSYRVPGGVKLHTHSNVCEGSLFTTLQSGEDSPDLQIHCGAIFFNPSGFIPEGEGYTLTPSLIHPRSRGTITLRSSDPEDKPIITPNYLTDKDGYDLAQLVAGVKFGRELGSRMVGMLGGEEEYPGPDVVTDEQIAEYVRRYVGTMYHPTSTCRMGPDGDADAVCDTELHVRGVRGLRVVDASVMPLIVGANTNATCVALGEKAASMVVAEHSKNRGAFGKSDARKGQSNKVGCD